MKSGNMALFTDLVEKYASQFRFDVFGDVAWGIIRFDGDRASVARYLVQKCDFDINTIYQLDNSSPGKLTFLQQAACLEHDPQMVEILLKEGANPDSPGFPYTPLSAFLKRTRFSVPGTAISAVHIVELLQTFTDLEKLTRSQMVGSNPISRKRH